MMQATLTLPGIAAIALTLGMAIDANVLINERIREELRGGTTPQMAIQAGYERAFGTILDSNVTTLIAGLALLVFGSGPGARLRGGALPGHPHLDLQRGGGLARHRRTSIYGGPPSAAKRATQSRMRANDRLEMTRLRDDDEKAVRDPDHGILPDPPHIPFMRHAMVFNIISLVTFLARGGLPAVPGLHFSIEFTGGTVMEVAYAAAADADEIRTALDTHRPRRRVGAELRHLARRA